MDIAAALPPEAAARGLLAPGRPVVVLVSGGRDSTCLLDLAVRVSGPGSVLALHFNFGLREAAGAEEAGVAELCGRLGVELDVRRPARPAETGNLQAWARAERYAAAAALVEARGGDAAAGHTASDQAETVLYRLAAAPGRRALLGMRERDGALVRPLLGVTREQTAEYCRARGLAWAEDESNADRRYARARVRHALVPALEDVHPAAVRNVVATARLLREEGEALDALIAAELAGDAEEVAVARLGELPRAVARLVVRELAERVAGRPVPSASRRFDEIVALGEGALDIGEGTRARVRGGRLRFEATPPLPG